MSASRLSPDYTPFVNYPYLIPDEVAAIAPHEINFPTLNQYLPSIFIEEDEFALSALTIEPPVAMEYVHSFHIDGVFSQDEEPPWKFMINLSREAMLYVPYLDVDPASVDLVYDEESGRDFRLGAPPIHTVRYAVAEARDEDDDSYVRGILFPPSQVLHSDCEGRFGYIVASYMLIN